MKRITLLLLVVCLIAGAQAAMAANSCNVNAGPIWNQNDANKKCPTVCKNDKGAWTGQWWTTVPGQMSVCQCAVCTPETATAKDHP